MDQLLPTQVLLKWIGEKVWVLMKNERELVGILKGIDEYTNVILADCVEYERIALKENVETKHNLLLLSGSGINMIVKGEKTDL